MVSIDIRDMFNSINMNFMMIPFCRNLDDFIAMIIISNSDQNSKLRFSSILPCENTL